MAYTYHGTSQPVLPGIDLLGNTTDKKMRLGTVVNDNNGNSYRYVQANEALVVGDVVTPVALAAWDSGILVDGAGASGDTKLHVDTITTAKDGGFYTGYWISQAAAASKGLAYQIKSHPSFSASGEADVFLEGALEEAFANNAALNIYNPYLVEKVDATTEMTRGVAIGTIDANSYGFVQVGGHCRAVKVGHTTSAAIVLNEPLTPIGSGNEGALQGMAGNTEADIFEAALGKIIALEAVAANTTGFIQGLIQGQL